MAARPWGFAPSRHQPSHSHNREGCLAVAHPGRGEGGHNLELRLGRPFDSPPFGRLAHGKPRKFKALTHGAREGDDEVDFVLGLEDELYAIEVKSTRPKAGRGLGVFQQRFSKSKACLVNLENYARFSEDPVSFLKANART